MKGLAVAACVLAIPAIAAAQDPPLAERDLPPDVRARLLRIADAPDAARLAGPGRLAADRTLPGDALVVGGPFTVAGRVDGSLAVVDGSLSFERGASVGGDVVVIGGMLAGVDDAEIGGTLTVYGRERRTDVRGPTRNDPTSNGPTDVAWPRRDRGPRFRFAGSRFAFRTGESYNRVEGLPVRFGPIIETTGANPTRMQAIAVWRTESGASLDADQLGYDVRLEQFLGGRRTLLVGAGLHSVIEPIEDWRLHDLEASLATGLLHSDPRDHRERAGWSVFTRFRPRALPLDASLELRREDHDLVAAGDPFSLFGGDEQWRPQPLAATGELTSLGTRVALHALDDADDPVRGWSVDLTARQGLGGDLVRPALSPPAGPPIDDPAAFDAVDFDASFTHAFVDLRRYAPVGRGSVLSMRVAAGGAVTGAALPPQLQHTLGGAGSLPGHDRFAVDCGARTFAGAAAGTAGNTRFFPFYGCDRVALLQLEYSGGFGLDLGFGRGDSLEHDRGRDGRNGRASTDQGGHGQRHGRSARHARRGWADRYLDWSPRWVAFADAGRGWAAGTALGTGARASGPLYDVGLGLRFGRLGIYAALPLNGADGARPNLIVRLGRRF